MLPGKTYSAEEIVRILRRRKWVVICAIRRDAGRWPSASPPMPAQYRSETLIMVMPQRIPESYAKPIVTGRIEDRLPSISEQILSRSRLERIITDFDLYRAQQATGAIMEDLVHQMRNEVVVKLEGKESFRVSYVNRDARTAQKVTERLASLSIEENLKDRQDLTESTSELLESQLQDAKQRLREPREEARRVPPAVFGAAADTGGLEPAGDSECPVAVADARGIDEPRARAAAAARAPTRVIS